MEAVFSILWEPLLAPLFVGLVLAYFEFWLNHKGKK